MPFYFRKSVSAGPFRFNFSSGGVGMSVGVRGLRVGTGPRGHYVQAGRGGFYYRASLGRSSPRTSRMPASSSPRLRPDAMVRSDVEMVDVGSGDVMEMKEIAFSHVLADINEAHRKPRLSMVLASCAGALSILIMAIFGSMALSSIILVAVGWLLGGWLDQSSRAAVLYYDLEDGRDGDFRRVCEAFDKLAASAAAWHIPSGGLVRDLTTWKRQAGASQLVKRNRIRPTYSLPTVLKCNVTPPSLSVGPRTIYFLPDVTLVQGPQGFGAIGYSALEIHCQKTNFIETDGVPTDAQIVGQTWQHPNKSGGPDRRFKQNRQLPVCRYEAMHLSSPSGLSELVEFSRIGVVESFAASLRAIPAHHAVGLTSLA